MAENPLNSPLVRGLALAVIIVIVALFNAMAVTRLVEGAVEKLQPAPHDVREFAPRSLPNGSRFPDLFSVRRADRT